MKCVQALVQKLFRLAKPEKLESLGCGDRLLVRPHFLGPFLVDSPSFLGEGFSVLD